MSETVKAAGEAFNDMITYLVDQIIVKGFIPTEWKLSTIENSYKGKYVILQKEETIEDLN